MSKEVRPDARGANLAHLGDQGELWFAAALPRGWVWQPPRRDFGKDGLIVIRDETELHNIEFSVQIKTSVRPTTRDGHILLSGVSRSAVQYWFASPLPTLVVAVDISNKCGWFAWHLDLFENPRSVFEQSERTLTVRIPQSNQLDEAGWLSIRRDISSHFRSLQRALWNDEIVPPLLRTVNNLTRIAGNLMRIAGQSVPTPPLSKYEGMTLLIEQIELRDMMDTVRVFLAKIDSQSDPHKQISFLLASIEEMAIAAFPNLRSLPPKGQDIPADLTLALAPKKLLEARPKLVLAVVDLLRLLTSPRPSTKDKEDTQENVET